MGKKFDICLLKKLPGWQIQDLHPGRLQKSSESLYQVHIEHLMCLREKLTQTKELVAGRALTGREAGGRPQAGPPSLAVSPMMGIGQLLPRAPAALTFWDSNYRSESSFQIAGEILGFNFTSRGW